MLPKALTKEDWDKYQLSISNDPIITIGLEEELAEHRAAIEMAIQKLQETEENLLKKVMAQVLHREPTLEDAKDFQRLYILGALDHYTFAYKGIPLGKVYVRRYSVEFFPVQ